MGKHQYRNVLTRKFFEQEYIKNQKSISQIAKQTGAYWATVRNYALYLDIPLRTHKEQAAFSSPGGKRKYDDFLTKEFFMHYYLNSKISIEDLSFLTGINWHVLWRYMKRLKIPIRSHKEQMSISYPPKGFKMTEECVAFLDGLLLGDGSIPYRSSGTKSFTQGCKHREYIENVKARLAEYGITCSPILTRWLKDVRCKNGGYNQSFLQTHCYKTFELFRGRWYKNGKKQVPRDFMITPDSLLQWYLCDGNFYREIRLYTDAFPIQDILFLQKLFKKYLGIETRIIHMNSGFELAIKKSDCSKFLSYVGPSPVKCYKYKWLDNESVEAKIRKNRLAREKYHRMGGVIYG